PALDTSPARHRPKLPPAAALQNAFGLRGLDPALDASGWVTCPKLPPAAALQTVGASLARRQHLELVEHIQLVRLEPVDGLHLRRGGCSLKPTGRTPSVLVRHAHQAVFDGVLMDVIEP